MKRLCAVYSSVVGKKFIVAVTGFVLLGFLVLHAFGNLKAFLPDPIPGVSDIDVYARFLRTMGDPLVPRGAILWSIRIVLAASLLLHVICVFQLARRNQTARPVSYSHAGAGRATLPARTMMITGSLILVFVVVHLLQFTTGSIDADHFVAGAVYRNLYQAFQSGYYTGFYLLALSLVALHLNHGAWSLFQTLGLDNPDRNRSLRRLASALVVAIFLAFASVPVAFYSGALPSPSSTFPGANDTKG